MTAKKRTRQPAPITRARLLDATEEIMAVEGYAAVTTRRVAAKVGLTPALVHYYFPTTDDLLIAAYRRAAERQDERIQKALTSERPLHMLWKLYTDSSYMVVGLEFAALSNHRKHIRNEIAKHDERNRRLQARALAGTLAKSGLDSKQYPPISVVMLLEGMSRAFVMERLFGLSCGHAETEKLVSRLLDSVEKPPKAVAKSRPTAVTERTKIRAA